MYIPEIGDVVKYNGKTLVVVDMKNYENIGRCTYDRKYLLCDLDILNATKGMVSLSDLDRYGIWIIVRGTEFPHITKITDIAPFDIENVECKKIRQKTLETTITIPIYK